VGKSLHGRASEIRHLLQRVTGSPPVKRAKAWFGRVAEVSVLEAQAEFIRGFMPQLFEDLDAGRLTEVQSIHFHRLGPEVRFRLIAAQPLSAAVAAAVEKRLSQAKEDGVITDFRSEPEGDWEAADARYGIDVEAVGPALTQFLEGVSRATIALLAARGSASVPEQVLWNWLHLAHNTMTGIQRHLVEVQPGAAIHTL
jgi:hypothetical protein